MTGSVITPPITPKQPVLSSSSSGAIHDTAQKKHQSLMNNCESVDQSSRLRTIEELVDGTFVEHAPVLPLIPMLSMQKFIIYREIYIIYCHKWAAEIKKSRVIAYSALEDEYLMTAHRSPPKAEANAK